MPSSIELRYNVKSADCFNQAPNTAYQDLEAALGIRFEKPPARIPYTISNRFKLVRREGIQAWNLLGKGVLGGYFGAYNAYFDRLQNDHRYTSWHENMHGYIYSVNPDAPHTYGHIRELFVKRVYGKEPSPGEIRRIAVFSVIHEGIAEWAAIKTAEVLGTEKEKEEAQKRKEDYESKEKREGKTYLNQAIGDIERCTSVLERVSRRGINPKTPELLTATINLLEATSYVLGYNFVNQAMEAFSKRGMKTAAALDMLIKYPPLNTSELREPRRYVFDRLKPQKNS